MSSSVAPTPPRFTSSRPIALPQYNEYEDTTGEVRKHQQLLQQFLDEHGADRIEGVKRAIRERLSEQEVTFNILGVPEGTNRPWQLDPLPLVLDHGEYVRLSEGLKQRAALLDLVLSDLYGPQQLLKTQALPRALVLENPRFWRACHGWVTPRLELYGADVSRDADGRFVVYSDRTAAPAGSGYALENRLALGRTLSDLFKRYSVLKLNRFFQAMRRTVEGLAPRPMEQPQVVILTPGMQDESSFEHAYLARYLGYELVEGRDLTVRDDIVYMKTLSGLKRVDVILRRVFDDYCDPLELRADSVSGVPGLLGAARAGTVGIANPLGTALVESAAFKAYLPKLCRELLGQDLKLESVPTLWCGDPVALRQVLGSLDDFVLKPAFSDRRGEPLRPSAMSPQEREAVLRRLQSRPSQFVAERWDPRWIAPFWGATTGLSGQVSLRMFLCRSQKDFDVMTGGIARIDSAPDGMFLSLSTDRIIKDVWVPSPTPAPDLPLPSMPDRRVELRRGGVELPSRLLDDIYWLGRYVERADNTARLARTGFERLSYEAPLDLSPVLDATLEVLHFLEVLEPVSAIAGSEDRARAAETALIAALRDRRCSNSLHATLDRVHGLTLGVRTRLSRDAWHVLRMLRISLVEIEGWQEKVADYSVLDFLDRLLIRLAAVSGAVLDNMVRGNAWVFMDMGRRVERAVFILALLKMFLPAGAVRVHMEALLELSDSLLTYRARYLSSLQPAPVVDLLLTDESNPHSLRYQVDAIARHLERLPRESEALRGQAERRMIKLQADLLTVDVFQLCAGDGSLLRRFVDDATTLLFQFSEDLTQRFFSHAETAQVEAPPSWISEDLEGR